MIGPEGSARVGMSIASRVSLACGAMLSLSTALLVLGAGFGEQVGHANERVGALSRMLAAQEREDAAQRRARLAIGDVTRLAERGRPVDSARWAALRRDLAAVHSPIANVPADAASPGTRAALARTHRAEAEFVLVGRRLVDTARRDSQAIKAAMPGFLGALRGLETARTDAREALVHEIDGAVGGNLRQGRRSALRLSLGAAAAFAITFALTIWLRRRVVSPIVAIAARLRGFESDGKDGAAVPGLDRGDELGDLARGLSEYREAVEARRAAQRRADFLAHHDMLTGLPNRLLFEERLAHELARSRRTGERVAVFAIDLDGFKAVNDRLGHAGGDAALRRAADLLRGCVRADDLVARIGGDEFAVIQASGAQPAAAQALADRLFRATAASVDDPPVRFSAGIALSGDGRDGEELHNLADMALYRAKSEGRNAARFFDDKLQEEIRLRRRLARDLEGAADRGELHLAFQPVADAAALRVVGREALLRWRHPELGEVGPDLFVPVAESSGLIGRLGAWAADRAFAAAARWDPELLLSINLSPVQFRDPDLARDLLATAARHGLLPHRLEFEVTESATLLGPRRDTVLATLGALQRAGARVAMDDFGTGHSSLSNLKDFGFDKLKIDRSFVAAMLDHPPAASIVRATIGLGRSLRIPVVAEGVEREAELALLREWGCNQVQGYLIGRPAADVMPGAGALA